LQAKQSAAEKAGDGTATDLARRLGLLDITLLVMGTVIGIGIFAVPHTVAGLVPRPGLVLGAWFLGGCVALAGSLVYAELTRRRPHVGGQYAFLREAYHPAVAFLYGWALLWVVQSGGMASVAVIFAQYFLGLLRLLAEALPHEGSLAFAAEGLGVFANASWAAPLVTTVAIGSLALINCAGVRAAGTTQNIFMLLKILAILMLVVCGLLFAGVPGEALLPEAALGNSWQLVTAFGAALVPVFFAYGGWHTTTFIAGEVSDPQRILPRGLVLGVSGVIALYLAVNFACLRVLGVEKLAATEQPASEVMLRALGGPGAVLISLGITISALGFLSQAMLTSPRVYYAMAQDRLFFPQVAWVHPRTRVPVVAILLQGAFAIVIAVSGTFAQIVNYVMSVELLFFVLTSLGLFVIRRRDALTAATVVAMPGHPVTTLLFAGVNLVVLADLFYTFPLNSALGLGIALAGLPVYFFWRWRSPASRAS
jgi:APA family basic amino acid/polyamine antiporter